MRLQLRSLFAALAIIALSTAAQAEDAPQKPQPPAALKEKAEKGDVTAMRDLGLFYRDDKGGNDWVIAHTWFAKAAEKGDVTAQYETGRDFWNSGGIPRDDKKGLKWLEKSAKAGNADAKRMLGDIYLAGDKIREPVARVKPDEKRAVALLTEAAAQGNARAQFNLGRYYYRKGGEKYPEAFKNYKLAAEQGHAGAQQKLGQLYAYGYGTPQDYTQSIAWYEKAAAQGDMEAEYALALAYLRGDEGVAKDGAKAASYFQKVDAHDWDLDDADDRSLVGSQIEAKYRLGLIYREGTGVKKDLAEAARWFALGARSRSGQGCYLLGQAYENGEGVPKDKRQAYFWYAMSVQDGTDAVAYFGSLEQDAYQYDDKAALARVAATMTPVELDQAKADVADERRRIVQVDWENFSLMK